jgi:hypothetical protein
VAKPTDSIKQLLNIQGFWNRFGPLGEQDDADTILGFEVEVRFIQDIPKKKESVFEDLSTAPAITSECSF